MTKYQFSGSSNMVLKSVASQTGSFKFPSNDQLEQKRICAISPIVFRSNSFFLDNREPAIEDWFFATFFTLYNDKNELIATRLPAFAMLNKRYGSPLQFKPTKLNFSMCIIEAISLQENESLSLTVFYQ